MYVLSSKHESYLTIYRFVLNIERSLNYDLDIRCGNIFCEMSISFYYNEHKSFVFHLVHLGLIVELTKYESYNLGKTRVYMIITLTLY